MKNVSAKKSQKVNLKRVAREIAMQFLYQFDLSNCEFNRKELDLFWLKIEQPEPDLIDEAYFKSKTYAERLIFGVIEHLEEINQTIIKYSEKWSLDRMAIIDRNILRIAVFEMLYCHDIPPVVSINEAVEISKDFATEKSGAFVNGVLNGVKDSLDRPAREATK